jgi:hypothetical protein
MGRRRTRRNPAVPAALSVGEEVGRCASSPRARLRPELGLWRHQRGCAAEPSGVGCGDQMSGEAQRNVGQHARGLAHVGSSRGVGKTKRSEEGAEGQLGLAIAMASAAERETAATRLACARGGHGLL